MCFVDITFGEFERTKSILKINYIFTVKWAAKINGKEMDWLRLRIARERKKDQADDNSKQKSLTIVGMEEHTEKNTCRGSKNIY